MAARVIASIRRVGNAQTSCRYFTTSVESFTRHAGMSSSGQKQGIHTMNGAASLTLNGGLFRANGSLLSSAVTSPLHLAKRWMSMPAMTKKHIRERVLLNLQLFDKVNPDKLTVDSHFHKDLGLDSLDHVEVIMAIEDEFSFEIPDRDAQRLLTPGLIAQYVADKYDVFDEDEHHHGDHGHDHAAHVDHGYKEDDPWGKENKPHVAPAHH